MIQMSPRIMKDILVYEQQGQTQSLQIGTQEWYAWLSTASLFTMTTAAGTFTVRKERAGSKRGGWYWKVYQRQQKKVRSAYLGKTESLTWDRLTTVIQRLSTSEPLTACNQEGQHEHNILAQSIEREYLIPLPLTALVGRDQEIARLENLVCQQKKRLITLTGTGGVGKTHLAQHVARALLPTFADGVIFIPLEMVRKSEQVLITIAHALGVSARDQQAFLAAVIVFLQKKQMLLVLDNFEQVVEAASEIQELVIACPSITIFITSRMPLHLRGEQLLPLAPLALPELDTPAQPETLLSSPAVSLFVYHAQAHLPSFQLTERNAATVRAICQHLDGLPLALELVAARLPLFPPEALLTHLMQQISLVTGSQQNIPVRQQTLAASFVWSYQLLDPHEQRLFRLLSVFARGWTPQAVEWVVRKLGDQDLHVLQGLISLLDKNLIQRSDAQESEARFRLLETTREYTCLLFSAQDEHEQKEAHDAHAAFYLQLAEEAASRFGDSFHLLLPCLEPEYDNLRAALQWFLEQGKTREVLRLGSALEWFWAGGSYWSEGRWWLEQMLVQKNEAVTSERAKALAVAGKLAQMQGEYEQAILWGQEGLALFRQSGESQGIITALAHLAYTELECGAYDRAVLLGEEALQLEQQRGGYTRGLRCMLIKALVFAGMYERAELLAEEVQDMSQRLKDQTGLATVNATRGVIAFMQNDLSHAQSLLEAAQSGYRAVGFFRLMLETEGWLAFLAIQQGNIEAARKRYLELAQQCFSGGKTGSSPLVLAMALRGLGIIAAQQGALREAVRCWGVAEKLNSTMFPFEREPYRRQKAAVRAQLGDDRYTQIWNQGVQVSPEILLGAQQQMGFRKEEGIAQQPQIVSSVASVVSPVVDTFTGREIEVLRLLAQGKTDRQIAEQLVISPRTVNTHVTSLYRKIDVTSRSAATRYAVEHGFFSAS